MITKIATDSLYGHPLNRAFDRSGEGWADFVESIRRHGVVMPCVARPHGKGWQLIAGHRRAAAAAVLEMEEVPCVVREMADGEALELLLNENLQREDLTPADEARLIAAMSSEMGLSAEEIAERVSRSVMWVRTRQMLLDLGDELLRRVSVPRGDDEHVAMGSVAAILEVPEPLREEAVQLVLHPALQEEALRPMQAQDCLRCLLIEPWVREKAWNERKKVVVAEWRKLLKEQKVDMDGLLVVAVAYRERETAARGTELALDLVPAAECGALAPSPCRWLDVAQRHGLALKVVPDDNGEDSTLRVDANLLRQAEAVRKEHGEAAWLSGKPTAGDRRAAEQAEKDRVAAAQRDCDGEVEHQQMTEEAPQVVIEQTMKHAAWIDMGAVKRLAMWAVATDSDPAKAQEWVPKWARDFAYAGEWEKIDQVCNWVLGLKGKSAE